MDKNVNFGFEFNNYNFTRQYFWINTKNIHTK